MSVLFGGLAESVSIVGLELARVLVTVWPHEHAVAALEIGANRAIVHGTALIVEMCGLLVLGGRPQE